MALGDLLTFYMKYQTRRDELEMAFKASVAPIDERMDQIKALIHKRLLEEGTKNFSTGEATAYLSNKSSATVGNRAEFLDFVDEQYQKEGKEALYWLKIAAADAAVKQYVDDHKEPPPGIDYKQSVSLVIRKKRQTGESHE